jgi:hypothetical protein
MTIDALAESPPRYTKVVLHVSAESAEAFRFADPGDAVVLAEHAGGVPTGGSITALVLERIPRSQSVLTRSKSPR